MSAAYTSTLVSTASTSDFHGAVQGVAVGNVAEHAATAEGWQGGDSPPLSLRAKQQAQRSLHQFGHRAALPCRLALELAHNGVIDVESGLRKVTHTIDMGMARGPGQRMARSPLAFEQDCLS